MNKYALVMPFCKKDISELLFNISLWEKEEFFIGKKQNIDLILYFTTSDEKSIENIGLGDLSYLEKYFDNIILKTLNITKQEDKYPTAPKICFFKILLEMRVYSSIFYCEADCLPVKRNWLEGLYNEFILFSINNNWIRGVMYSGKRKLFNNEAMRKHVNGNAFFSVNTDESYNMFREIYEILKRKSGNYDVELMIWMYQNKNKHLSKIFFEHLEYTNFLLNFGKQDIEKEILNRSNLLEETYFIHGKKYIKNLQKL